MSGARARRRGRPAAGALSALGDTVILAGASLARAVRPPVRPGAFLVQLHAVGVRSLGLSIVTAAFAGMVMAFQFGDGLGRFGARVYIGQTTVTALVRELAPILTALVVGGRVGAGITAELSGMAVTEQLDAMRALGADPWQRLVAPRLVAVIVAMPLLSVCADVVGFFGGMLVASAQYGVSPTLFTRGVLDFVEVGDVTSGLGKAVVFGVIVGAIACREGLRARGGTEGVGQATTRTVVASSLSVLAADLLLTKILLLR